MNEQNQFQVIPLYPIEVARSLIIRQAISRNDRDNAAFEAGVSVRTIQNERRRLNLPKGKPCDPPEADEWLELLKFVPRQAIEIYMKGNFPR